MERWPSSDVHNAGDLSASEYVVNGGLVRFDVSQVLSLVHAKAPGTASESVSLGAEFAGMAVLAVKFAFVFGAVGRVQELTAQSALEAHFVPFQTSSYPLFSGVD